MTAGSRHEPRGAGLTAVEERMLRSVDEQYTIGLLKRLVAFPSYFPHYEEIAAFVEGEMRGYGLDVFVKGDSGTGQVESPALAERALVYADEFAKTMTKPWTRPNVVGSVGGTEGGPTLILRAHTDVVPAYNRSLWRTDPFVATEVDGAIYGRGTADAKGSLAAMMAAVRAVQLSGVRLRGNLLLVAWVGDEFKPPDSRYFDGISYLATHDLIKGEMCIAGEPYDLRICPVTRGRIWFSIHVGGESTHGANYPAKGVNAILQGYKLIQEILQLPLGEHPLTGKDSINLGTIHGGKQPNIVPEDCYFTFDIRFAPPLTSFRIEEMVHERIQKLTATDPTFTVKSIQVTERREPLEFPRDCPLTQAMLRAGRAVGRELQFGGAVSFGALASYKDRVGIKECVYFGPGETEQAHATNERVPIADLLVAAKVYALTIAQVCGAHD